MPTSCPDTSRFAQEHPAISRSLWNPPEPSRMLQSIPRPSGATRIHQECVGPRWTTWRHLAILEPSRTPKHRTGATIKGSHPPLNVWHMSVTSPSVGLHPRHLVGLPLSGPGDKSNWYSPGVTELYQIDLE